MDKILLIILSLFSLGTMAQTVVKIDGKSYVINNFEVHQSGRVLIINGASETLKNHIGLVSAKCEKAQNIASSNKDSASPGSNKNPFQNLLNDLEGGFSGLSNSIEGKKRRPRTMKKDMR